MQLLISLVLWLGVGFLAEAEEPFEALLSDLESIESLVEGLDQVNQAQPQTQNWPLLDQARFWNYKGLLLEASQKVPEAVDAFETAVDLFEQNGSVSPHWIRTLGNLSYMQYLQTNNPEVYCPAREQAVTLARQLQDTEVLARSLARLAYCYQDRFDDLKQGLALLQEAMDLAERDQLSVGFIAYIHNATGNLYRSNKLPEKAYEYYQKAFNHWSEINDLSDMFNMQHNLTGEAIEMGLWTVSNSHVNKLYEMSQSTNAGKDFQFFAHFNAGRLAYATGAFSEAVQALKAAQGLSDTTAEQYFVDMTDALLILAYFRSGHLDQARHLVADYMQQPNQSPAFFIWNEQVALVQLYFEQNHAQAMQKFWQIFDWNTENQQAFMKNAVAAQASSFDQAMLKLQEQAVALKSEQVRNQTEIARLNNFVVALTTALLVAMTLFLLWSRHRYKQSAETDFLTGAASRRHLMTLFERMMPRVNSQNPLSLVLLDIDGFKDINDRSGHAVGDHVLKQLVKTIQKLSKQPLGRYGGEEFILLLPGTDADAAKKLAETMRQRVESLVINTQNGELGFTISMGLATTTQPDELQQLIDRADAAMYVAKSEGKNRVISAPNHVQEVLL